MGIFWKDICFKWLSKNAINYETKAEIKKELRALVRNFAFTNFMESKKTGKLHTVLSKKFNDKLIIDEETSEKGLGVVDKFVALFS